MIKIRRSWDRITVVKQSYSYYSNPYTCRHRFYIATGQWPPHQQQTRAEHTGHRSPGASVSSGQAAGPLRRLPVNICLNPIAPLVTADCGASLMRSLSIDWHMEDLRCHVGLIRLETPHQRHTRESLGIISHIQTHKLHTVEEHMGQKTEPNFRNFSELFIVSVLCWLKYAPNM